MGVESQRETEINGFISERHAYAQKFHELVGTKAAVEGLLPQTEASRVSYVEDVFSYLARHGLNGGDNREGLDEARDYVWVSGYSFDISETSYPLSRPQIVFAGLTQYVGSNYFGGMKPYRPGMRLGAAKVVKGFGYKIDDLAMAAKNIDDKHSSNVGRFPLQDFSMQQLEDESFISSAKVKLERQLGFLA